MDNFKRQRGTVLLVALFIVALLEIVVVAFVMHHKMAVYHSRNYFGLQEAISLLFAAEEQAKNALMKTTDAQTTPTAFTMPRITLKEGFVDTIVVDTQGKFNLNNLLTFDAFSKTPKNLGDFSNLLNTLFRGEQNQVQVLIEFLTRRYELAQAIFIQQNTTYYFSSITELRSIPGISQSFFVSLMPYISALPAVLPLNVNSATDYSLLTLNPKLTKKETDTIIQLRASVNGFNSVEAFEAIAPIAALEGDHSQVTTQSLYFMATFIVHYRDIELTMNSLLKIYTEDDKPRFAVVWRSFGTV